MAVDNVRGAFEAWFRKERIGFESHMLAWHEGVYVNTITQTAYCGWCGAVKWIADSGAIKVVETR